MGIKLIITEALQNNSFGKLESHWLSGFLLGSTLLRSWFSIGGYKAFNLRFFYFVNAKVGMIIIQ
jgi:hypothetical protein